MLVLPMQETTMQEPISPKLRKYIVACLIGNGLEWYDFAIFGYFVPLFSAQFFPTTSEYTAIINAFAVFAVGFLSRPLGAYVLGKLGDKQGRKKTMLFSVLLMAISTSLMGLLPTYNQVGLLAPIGLTLLRIFQGISIGGEYTSSLAFLIEHTPQSRRGFVGTWTYMGSFLGIALGALIGTLVVNMTTADQLEEWGWRIPFLLGSVIAYFGYYIRKTLEETPLFLELKKTNSIEKQPFKKVVKSHWKNVFVIVGLILPSTVWVYLLVVFLPVHMTKTFHWDLSVSLMLNFFTTLCLLLFLPIAGQLSDLYGRKRIISIGFVLTLASAPLIFSSVIQEYPMLVLGFSALTLSFAYGPTAALLSEMFPTPIRSTGMAVSYHLATGVFGGLTPLILTWLSVPLTWVLFALAMGFMSLACLKSGELCESY